MIQSGVGLWYGMIMPPGPYCGGRAPKIEPMLLATDPNMLAIDDMVPPPLLAACTSCGVGGALFCLYAATHG